MRTCYDASTPRRPTNLSLNSDLVEKARAARLNLSSIAEKAIGEELAKVMEQHYREEVARSVAEHAAYLEQYGSLADAVRAAIQDQERG